MKVTTDSCLFGAWVAQEIQSSTPQSETRNILDIGTGTGLLSLMIAQKNQDIVIDAIEIDMAAAIQANQNVSASDWKKKINVIEADVKTIELSHLYDVIISNPPFYENELASPDPKKKIAHHDEGILLEELLIIIKKNLKKNGKFFLLSSNKRHKELEKLFSRHGLFVSEKLLVRQTVNHTVTRVIYSGSNSVAEKIIISEISIRDDKQQYTPEFTTLLEDYYLNF
jgi:tRNA1Val (adenine37-N6)-methyltransferase